MLLPPLPPLRMPIRLKDLLLASSRQDCRRSFRPLSSPIALNYCNSGRVPFVCFWETALQPCCAVLDVAIAMAAEGNSVQTMRPSPFFNYILLLPLHAETGLQQNCWYIPCTAGRRELAMHVLLSRSVTSSSTAVECVLATTSF